MLPALGLGVTYAVTGVLLLAGAYALFDLVTPGRLSQHVWVDRSVNASIVLTAMVTGMGAVLFTAIWSNDNPGAVTGWLWSVAFALLGLVLQVAGFLLLDLCTPGSLREISVDTRFHPGVLVTSAGMLATSAVVCASLT